MGRYGLKHPAAPTGSSSSSRISSGTHYNQAPHSLMPSTKFNAKNQRGVSQTLSRGGSRSASQNPSRGSQRVTSTGSKKEQPTKGATRNTFEMLGATLSPTKSQDSPPRASPSNTIQGLHATSANPTPQQKQLTFPAKQPTAPLIQTTAPLIQTTSPLKQPTAPQIQTSAPLIQTTSPLKQPSAPLIQMTSPLKQPTGPQIQTTSPLKSPIPHVQHPTSQLKQPTETQMQPTSPLKPPTPPVQHPTSPLKQPTGLQMQTTSPFKPPAPPVQHPTSPLKQPTGLQIQTTSPLKPPTPPVQHPTSPLKQPTGLQMQTTSPLKPPTAPVQHPTSPLKQPTGFQMQATSPLKSPKPLVQHPTSQLKQPTGLQMQPLSTLHDAFSTPQFRHRTQLGAHVRSASQEPYDPPLPVSASGPRRRGSYPHPMQDGFEATFAGSKKSQPVPAINFFHQSGDMQGYDDNQQQLRTQKAAGRPEDLTNYGISSNIPKYGGHSRRDNNQPRSIKRSDSQEPVYKTTKNQRVLYLDPEQQQEQPWIPYRKNSYPNAMPVQTEVTGPFAASSTYLEQLGRQHFQMPANTSRNVNLTPQQQPKTPPTMQQTPAPNVPVNAAVSTPAKVPMIAPANVPMDVSVTPAAAMTDETAKVTSSKKKNKKKKKTTANTTNTNTNANANTITDANTNANTNTNAKESVSTNTRVWRPEIPDEKTIQKLTKIRKGEYLSLLKKISLSFKSQHSYTTSSLLFLSRIKTAPKTSLA